MNIKKILFYSLLIIFIIFLIYSYFHTLNIKRVEVKGNSLEPYISAGEKIWLNYNYQDNNKEIARDSLITLYFKAQDKELIKFAKVIPGDEFKVDTINKALLINGELMINKENKIYRLTEQNIKMLQLYEKDFNGKLGENVYFVFGNFPGTLDSGRFGPVLRKNILGKALFK